MIGSLFRQFGKFLYETIQTVVVFLSIFAFIYYLAVQPHQIQGDSMLPNFVNNEYILTDKITYRFSEPIRGNIVVFKAPNNSRRDYIKRIIALPEESISLKDNQIYVNGEPLDEYYLDPDEQINGGAYLAEGAEITLAKGEYFVLGDNRDHSQDSRTWGPITRDKIIGRVIFRYWPPKVIGQIQAVNY